MTARAMWSGDLKIAATRIPIKLYAAIHDETVHFHILDAKSRQRVKQRWVDPESGEEVPANRIQKGFGVGKDEYVFFDEKDIEKLAPKASSDIVVTHFVPAGQVSHLWYDHPYYVGPTGDAGTYFALVEALEASKKEGVARWVMRKKAYIGALTVVDGYLALIALRHADEVWSESDIPAPRPVALSGKELKMAEQLVEALDADFDLSAYRDHYHDKVMDFVRAKARGRKPKLGTVRRKRATTSLASDLERSLAALEHRGSGKGARIA